MTYHIGLPTTLETLFVSAIFTSENKCFFQMYELMFLCKKGEKMGEKYRAIHTLAVKQLYIIGNYQFVTKSKF